MLNAKLEESMDPVTHLRCKVQFQVQALQSKAKYIPVKIDMMNKSKVIPDYMQQYEKLIRQHIISSYQSMYRDSSKLIIALSKSVKHSYE